MSDRDRKKSEERVRIFDTTLRDGEQSPGASMQKEEKLQIARQLEKMGVDILEAGFPVASPDDFAAVCAISEEIRHASVCALSRCRSQDIEAAARSLEKARSPRIHTFLATSALHMEKKLKLSPEEVLETIDRSVRQAVRLVGEVEFSAEDATRSDRDFLARAVGVAIAAGARTINIPDTVGYALPTEFKELLTFLRTTVPGADGVIFSAHCHNDLGLAVANSLAAVEGGARQIECTINGIGERAGNAAMEEVVMALRVRKAFYHLETGIRTEEFVRASRLVSTITGMLVQPNKAIVGANAFAHESGIHQDGLLKDKRTYEIMLPEQVGLSEGSLVLGKHSGRHAFRARIETLGFRLSEEELSAAFLRFKKLADQKKEIYDEDIETLLSEGSGTPEADRFRLERLAVSGGTLVPPTATIVLSVDGEERQMAGLGTGPVDAIYRTLSNLTGSAARLLSFTIKGITGGSDALGEVTVRLEEEGRVAAGHGADTDILVAAARAYLEALNRLERKKERDRRAGLSSQVSL
ncbi:MAG: 2-isopropylmalate synthase [Leptospirillia bacterium]